jgi:polysaccharide export outer membrane protein
MIINFRFIFFLTLSFLLTGCLLSTGIDKSPKNKESKFKQGKPLSEINVKIVDLNKLTLKEIDRLNNKRLNKNQLKIIDYPEIYNYDYKYILGPADTINLDLTDTDDLDSSYKIGSDGTIDLPFIGKLNINNLSIVEAEKHLTTEIKSFYKYTDLQIEITEYNSSKAFFTGAIREQKTIQLDQKPIRIIEAAIQANFNPNSGSKLYGTKGFLRRDGKAYSIDLMQIIQDKNKKENFFIKKDDVIFIERNSDTIHIFGEISKPGIYFENLNYSLTELLSSSGVNKLTANAKNIFVIRENFEKNLHLDVFKLDIRNPTNLIIGKKFLLQTNDVVYVPAARIVKFNRIISLLLPQTDLFNSYNPIIQDGVKGGANVNVTE